ncbi:MAG: ABC transporter ATP-binding protein [Legionella sp.]|nr:ABC transporter ATP-binding protein [Legionella sp.]
MTELAEIKALQVAFQTDERTITAVDNISFTLKPGETLALLGESGCGKSLTALALMRLLPNHGVYGLASEIKLEGEDLLELPEWMMRQLRGRRLAIIFQEPMTALNPVLRIGEQLAEALQHQKKLPGISIKSRLIELLEKVEIPNPELRLRQYPHQLSGGQKQRVVIAMALANNPEILIADEPTTALDVTIQAQILRLLKKLQVEQQMSMLLITHDLGVVKAAADNVCVMYAGQLVETASVQAFFNEVKHPYSQQLLASLPNFNKRDTRLQAIEGTVPTLDALPAGCRFHPRCAHVFSPCKTIVPLLQEIEERKVRCHLYPEHSHLPPLLSVQNAWPERIESTELLFSVNNLCVYFSVGKSLFKQKREVIKAVDGLSLKLYKGKTLALVGESGCGKTTASRALIKLIPVTSGDIHYRGQSVTTLKGAALRDYRKRVQIIFQDPYASMNPRMSVGEIIAEGMVAQGLGREAILRKQLTLLDQVRLSKESINRYPHQFSGGQRQRICIARALASEPEVLICDEPTSALDVSVQAQILNLLKELQLELGMSYLFITHNMSVVSYLADDVLVMRDGRAVEEGSSRDILKNPEAPYTRELLSSVLVV